MENMEGFVPLVNGAKCIQCDNSDSSKFWHYIDGDESLGVCCVKCKCEYLQETLLVSPSQENGLELGKETFYKKAVAIDTPDSSVHMVHPARRAITDLSLCADYLKPGDHIAWERPYLIWHHAIVSDVNTESNTVEVIHWTSQKGERAEIKKEELDLKTQSGNLCCIDYDEEVIKENPPRLVLARARSRLREKGYNFLSNNCESFATFCKKGVERSQQVRWGLKALVDLLKRTLGSLTGKLCQLLKATIFPSVEVTTAEAIEAAANNYQWIGFGLVVLIEGVITIVDIKKLYKERKNGNQTRKVFIQEVTKRVTEAILAGGLAAAGGLVPGPGGIFVGIIGGTFGKLVGSWLGAKIGRAITRFIKTDDKAVKNITELKTGDHIVWYKHFAHPRHHCIVLRHDGISKVSVIHNTHCDGVKQEWIDFVDPVYKVIYEEEEDCHSDNEVVARAVSKLGERSYNLITYNCKHFAAWCKKR